MTRRADRLDPRQAKVEEDLRRERRGQKPAAGPIHVDVHVQAGTGHEVIEGGR